MTWWIHWFFSMVFHPRDMARNHNMRRHLKGTLQQDMVNHRWDMGSRLQVTDNRLQGMGNHRRGMGNHLSSTRHHRRVSHTLSKRTLQHNLSYSSLYHSLCHKHNHKRVCTSYHNISNNRLVKNIFLLELVLCLCRAIYCEFLLKWWAF